MEKKFDLTVTIGDTEKKYQFTELWQVIWFLKIANATVRFFDWIYGVKR